MALPKVSAHEFDKWLGHHNGLFPGFLDWFHAPERDLIVAEWTDTLGDYPYVWLKDASTDLWRRPDDEKPHGYSAHCGALLTILRARRHGEQQARQFPNCDRCQNTGFVHVQALVGHFGTGRPDGHVFCDCPRGDYVQECWAKHFKKHPELPGLPAAFHPQKHQEIVYSPKTGRLRGLLRRLWRSDSVFCKYAMSVLRIDPTKLPEPEGAEDGSGSECVGHPR